MQQLTKKEEEIMQVIWKLKKAFIREVVEALPEPRPHYNTVATIIKILVKKGVLTSEKLGNTHQYSPIIEYEQYRAEHLENFKEKFFDNSITKMFSHFAKNENLSEEEKKELIRLIKSNSNKS